MVVKHCGNTLEVFSQDCGSCSIKPVSFHASFTAGMKFSNPPVTEHISKCTFLCFWNGKKPAILWNTKLLNWVKTVGRKFRKSSAPFSHGLFLEDLVCSIRIHLELAFRFGQCPAGVCPQPSSSRLCWLVLSTPKKLINCLAFGWNVAFPVSQGNVVINIITDVITAVQCYMAGDVGHVPCSPQTSFSIGVSARYFYINMSVLTYSCPKAKTMAVLKYFLWYNWFFNIENQLFDFFLIIF